MLFFLPLVCLRLDDGLSGIVTSSPTAQLLPNRTLLNDIDLCKRIR